jgi:hypothetical protein
MTTCSTEDSSHDIANVVQLVRADPQKVIQRKGEFLKIRTSLCSTHLTQHRTLSSCL